MPPFLASLARFFPMDRDFEESLMVDNLAHPYNQRKSLVVHWHHLLTARCDIL